MVRESRQTQLENYDLTRKLYAVRTLEVLNRLLEAESRQASPNLTAISGLAAATAAILNAVT